jgi:CheY-like chemotaxis protein
MAAIATSYEILRKWAPEDPRLEEAVSVLGGQIRHLSRLVDDTLDISRLETGRLNLRKESVVIDALIEECAESFREMARRAGIKLTCETAAEDVTVDGDPSRLAQCIANLLSNSLKFTPQDGTVNLRTAMVDDEIEITVRDSGAGFAEGELDGFFEPFEQGSATARTTKDGMGLGLAVVKRLVELHGGSTGASSEGIDRGAAFSFRLPVTGTRGAPPEETAAPAAGDPPVSDADILIIEDNESVARSLALLLELDGHRVRRAADGGDAFELLGERMPDLVFCDLTLPGSMNGWDIAARVREQIPGPQAPLLVALSGHAMKQDIERSVAAGFDHHVPKPPEPARLRQLVADAVARRRAEGAPLRLHTGCPDPGK